MKKNRARQTGFTLVEMLVVVAIIGILSALAYTSYMSSVLKSGRSEATVGLNDVMQRLQRCFTTTNTFTPIVGRCAVVDELNNVGIFSRPEGFYLITAEVFTPGTVTLLAVPVAANRQIKDTRCTSFRLTQTGVRSALMGGVDNTDECW